MKHSETKRYNLHNFYTPKLLLDINSVVETQTDIFDVLTFAGDVLLRRHNRNEDINLKQMTTEYSNCKRANEFGQKEEGLKSGIQKLGSGIEHNENVRYEGNWAVSVILTGNWKFKIELLMQMQCTFSRTVNSELNWKANNEMK